MTGVSGFVFVKNESYLFRLVDYKIKNMTDENKSDLFSQEKSISEHIDNDNSLSENAESSFDYKQFNFESTSVTNQDDQQASDNDHDFSDSKANDSENIDQEKQDKPSDESVNPWISKNGNDLLFIDYLNKFLSFIYF
jgi:hypothetical protein